MTKITRSGFFRSIMVLAGGTAVAMLISFAVLPLITRLYSPADFGTLAVYVSILQLLSVAACLRFEIAIPLPEKDEDAVNILAIALLCVLIFSIVVGLAVYLIPSVVEDIDERFSFQKYLWLLPPGVLVAGGYSALQFWSVRKKNFSLIAKTRVSQSVTAAAVQLGMGAIKIAPLGLLIGHLFQTGAGIISLARETYVVDRHLIRSISWLNMRRIWCQYVRFPKYSVAESLAQVSSLRLPIIVIAGMSIGPEAGFLILAMRVMQAPVSLTGAAIAQVFASAAPSAFREGTLNILTTRTLVGMIKSVVGPAAFLGILAPQAFVLVFGSEWLRAGEIASWLSPLFITQLMASSLGTNLHVTSHQKLGFYLQIFGLMFRVGSVAIVGLISPNWVSETYAISGFLFYFIYLFVAIRCSSSSLSSLWEEVRTVIPYLSMWISCGFAVLYVARLI